jgi:hypothetical protein
MASMYAVCYLGFSLPAIAAGAAVSVIGLARTTIAYNPTVMLLTGAAIVGLMIQSRTISSK